MNKFNELDALATELLGKMRRMPKATVAYMRASLLVEMIKHRRPAHIIARQVELMSRP